MTKRPSRYNSPNYSGPRCQALSRPGGAQCGRPAFLTPTGAAWCGYHRPRSERERLAAQQNEVPRDA